MFQVLSLSCFAVIVWVLVSDPGSGDMKSHNDDGDGNTLFSALIGLLIAPFLAIGALLVFLFQILIAIGPLALFVIVSCANLLQMAFSAVRSLLRSAGEAVRSGFRSLERSSMLLGFLKNMRSILSDAIDALRRLGQSFSLTLLHVFKALRSSFRSFLPAFRALFKRIRLGVASLVRLVVTFIRSALDALAKIVIQVISALRRISIRGAASVLRHILKAARLLARQGLAAFNRVLAGAMKSLRMLFFRGIGLVLRDLLRGMRSATFRILRALDAILSSVVRNILSLLRAIVRWVARIFPSLAAVRWGAQSRSLKRSTEYLENRKRESARREDAMIHSARQENKNDMRNSKEFTSFRERHEPSRPSWRKRIFARVFQSSSSVHDQSSSFRRSAAHAVHGDRFFMRRQNVTTTVPQEDRHEERIIIKQPVVSYGGHTSKDSPWIKRIFAWASRSFFSSSSRGESRSSRRSATHAVHGDRFIRRQQGSTAVYVGTVDGNEVRITMASLPPKEKHSSMILPRLRQIGWQMRSRVRRLA